MVKRRAVMLTIVPLALGASGLLAQGPLSDRQVKRLEALRALEQQMQDAISRRDPAFLSRHTDPSFVRVDQGGKAETRAEVMAQIRKPPPTSDIIRRTIDPATHQINLHGEVAVTRGDLEVRGPRRAFRTTYTSVYRWRAGRWMVLSSTTISLTPLAP